MGREAVCIVRWGGQSAEVKALLETHELIVRGDIKKKVSLSALKDVRVDGDDLCFKAGRERVALTLGAKDAAGWAKKITTPPPSLKEKLGLKPEDKALVIGRVTDEVLRAALADAATTTATKAKVAVTQIESERELRAALASCPRPLPLWVVHRKGKAAAFGETPVRTLMRAAGYVDTKVSAVSAAFSATRYSRKER